MVDRVVVQFDKRDVEEIKLIKLDLLGLGMLAAIDETLEEMLRPPGATRGRVPSEGAAIIYCLSRKDAEEEAKRLRAAGWNAGWYHAGLTGHHRAEVQRRFMAGQLQVVAATNASQFCARISPIEAIDGATPTSSQPARMIHAFFPAASSWTIGP